ncbi:nuclear transport factor 2 family protein [Asticcacaulis sp. AND118]|uniref:nuclear transport factor 2 family protein n=1 Tax=Asticcacaulis sp. AND118 TaxID=2840468 RepID=UPI001CFFCE72|nr:nuclear transport factor 2 family protein [Asticcacaulis sp. AND118]UDF04450.1 nuclear transport factor 2 family protein [Asticcacaulis sp. AND118]
MSLSKSQYEQLSREWYAAWNAHDAGQIAALYADDLVFTSPFIAKMDLNETGTITGIEAFFDYLQKALPRVPNLKFEPVAICLGVDSNTVVYRNQSSHIVTEVQTFAPDGLILSANVAYSIAPVRRNTHGGH